jgi:hypothetical protein
MKMLFKNMKPKFDQKSENIFTTYVKTNLQSEEPKDIKSWRRISWFPTLLLLIISCVVLIPIIIWANSMNVGNNVRGKCHHNNKNGVCLTNSYCCDGEYVIGKDQCSGNGICCLGKVDKCGGS